VGLACLAAIVLYLLYLSLRPLVVLLGSSLARLTVRCVVYAGAFWLLTELLPEPFRTGLRKMAKATVRLFVRLLGSFFKA
jgi:hypothetical protein